MPQQILTQCESKMQKAIEFLTKELKQYDTTNEHF